MSGVTQHYALLGDVEAARVCLRVEPDARAVWNLAAFIEDRVDESCSVARCRRPAARPSVSIWLRSWTCTPENSNDWLTAAPEMMQPPETIELTAMPRRPSSSSTNFAGGCCSW